MAAQEKQRAAALFNSQVHVNGVGSPPRLDSSLSPPMKTPESSPSPLRSQADQSGHTPASLYSQYAAVAAAMQAGSGLPSAAAVNAAANPAAAAAAANYHASAAAASLYASQYFNPYAAASLMGAANTAPEMYRHLAAAAPFGAVSHGLTPSTSMTSSALASMKPEDVYRTQLSALTGPVL